MRFVDQAAIEVYSGKGGDGCVSFYRARNLARGGPDGGNGGRGGHVFLKASSPSLQTLLDFRYQRKFRAGNGCNGAGRNKTGANGNSCTIELPIGTMVKNEHTNELIADMLPDQPAFCIAEGGVGGLGNTHFKSSIKRAPKIATNGKPGRYRKLSLELKLLADIGIVGLPNAGKSSLLACLANANPKIGHYPFTTLRPNLGMLKNATVNPIIIADIPGIIENAHSGAGLGLEFLRHTARNRLLWHVIELCIGSNGKPDYEKLLFDYQTVENEFEQYSTRLKELPRWVVINKCDQGIDIQGDLKGNLKERLQKPVYLISCINKIGIEKLANEAQQWIYEDAKN